MTFYKCRNKFLLPRVVPSERRLFETDFLRRPEVYVESSDSRHVVTIMKVELEDIRAWVDGDLDEPRAHEVAVAVFADEKLRQIAYSMRASMLPYRQAYEHAAVVDVPESLRVSINALKKTTSR